MGHCTSVRRVDHDLSRRNIGKGLLLPPPFFAGSKAAAAQYQSRSCWSKKEIEVPLRIKNILLEEFDRKEKEEDPRPFYISYFDFLWVYLYSDIGAFWEMICSLGPWWGLSLGPFMISYRYSYPASRR